MEKHRDTWLTGFAVEISGIEMMVHHLITASDLEHAEAGAMTMGRTWWEDGKTIHEDYSWQYLAGIVWFNCIILLDDVETSVLRGLRFLDAWVISGTPDAPVITDEYGNDWRDITR